ncbi:hypothetical protein AB0L34_15895 [Micromonospora sp. NPDC052213]
MPAVDPPGRSSTGAAGQRPALLADGYASGTAIRAVTEAADINLSSLGDD